LALLLERPGQILTRLEIQRHVWGEDTHVDFEQGLNWCIRRIREALVDSPSDSRFIQTVPRRGYRFVAEVKSCPSGSGVSAPAPWRKPVGIVLVVCVVALAIVFGGVALGHHSRHPITVLVLPFDNMSGSGSGAQYEDIASNELTARLGHINPSRLSVIDPLTARKFKNTKECIRNWEPAGSRLRSAGGSRAVFDRG
jgi:Transcriptional regulatory protein, C terminal